MSDLGVRTTILYNYRQMGMKTFKSKKDSVVEDIREPNIHD